MSALKYAMGMLAVGATALTAGASQAGAIFVDNTLYQGFTGFTDGATFSDPIFLAGSSTAQFTYNGSEQIIDAGAFGKFPTVKNVLDANSTSRLNPNVFSSDALPNPGEVFSSTEVTTSFSAPGTTGPDSYFHLDFSANGVEYLGTAHVNTANDIDQIRFESLADIKAGVPEPASWALMILGVGAAGVALRRSRRNQSAVAAL